MSDSDTPRVFDMPEHGTWEQRGGWCVNAFASDYSLTLPQAAGIVGNLGFESREFTKLQEIAPAVAGSRGGFGFAQWTGPRRRAFEAWCVDQGLAPASDEANYNYVCVELDGAYSQVVRALRRCLTIDKAVFTFGRMYEAPGGTTGTHLPGYEGRLVYARRALLGARRAA